MSLEIIGPGFGRTGTNSLKLALMELGFGPCHHMFEVRDKPELLADWQAVADGRSVDWNKVFKGYRAQVDWPGAHVWCDLIDTFPQAKVVLSVRDPNGWFDSVQSTIAPFISRRGSHGIPHMDAIAHMCHKMISVPTFDDRLSDRDHAIGVFNRHIDEVKATVPAGRLLVFDVQEGWHPLCQFLGVDVPDTPFPKTNSSKEFADDNLN
jgi:hypothetical protein